MPPEVLVLLFDIRQACGLIREFTAGKSADDFRADVQLRSAVERQFITIGEALHQGIRLWPMLADSISDHRRIINFRNVIVHGYARVAIDTVWGVVESELDVLLSEVQELMPPEPNTDQ